MDAVGRNPSISLPFRKPCPHPPGVRQAAAVQPLTQGPGTGTSRNGPPTPHGKRRGAPAAFWVAGEQRPGARRGGSAPEVTGPGPRRATRAKVRARGLSSPGGGSVPKGSRRLRGVGDANRADPQRPAGTLTTATRAKRLRPEAEEWPNDL